MAKISFQDQMDDKLIIEDGETRCCFAQSCWYDPPGDSLAASYCYLNSMHGLKYLAEPKRHLSERICWLIAFLIGIGTAAYMINSVWENYRKNPVIVSFEPTETNINDIPFPAITICNMNIFPRSFVEELKRNVTETRVSRKSKRTGRVLDHHWNDTEIDKWKEWDYTNDGFILRDEISRPFRQNRAGIPFGLSLLIDGHTDEYFCSATDSKGFRLVLHTALEIPPVQNWGVTIGLNKEVFLEINPDLTLSDPKVAYFPYEKRKCFFQSEKSLEFYSAYTTSNCLNECIANRTANDCGCALFHMPRRESTRICAMHDTKDYQCALRTRESLTKNYKRSCKICDSLCTDIFYSFELSQADLQLSKELWGDSKNLSGLPPWAENNMTLIHLYFAFDSFVPRVRNELYATVDLIANTGGLLGLCLGFSALSVLEFIYFFTMRCFFTKIRKFLIQRKLTQKLVNAVRRSGWMERFDSDQLFKNNMNKSTPIIMNKNMPLYPTYSNHNNFSETLNDHHKIINSTKTHPGFSNNSSNLSQQDSVESNNFHPYLV